MEIDGGGGVDEDVGGGFTEARWEVDRCGGFDFEFEAVFAFAPLFEFGEEVGGAAGDNGAAGAVGYGGERFRETADEDLGEAVGGL